MIEYWILAILWILVALKKVGNKLRSLSILTLTNYLCL